MSDSKGIVGHIRAVDNVRELPAGNPYLRQRGPETPCNMVNTCSMQTPVLGDFFSPFPTLPFVQLLLSRQKQLTTMTKSD
jgi:hypothetical protein